MTGSTNQPIEIENNKFILDACCGGKMFWFNKQHPNTLYIDNRKREAGHEANRPNHKIIPDVVCDFRELPFPDKSFKLVVMDPPHLLGSENGHMLRQYGWLNRESWKEDIKKGFDECWRVLDDFGVLIFKWNEASIKRKEILEVIQREPLFGHQIRSKIPTHWFCFMKIANPLTSPNGDFSKEKEHNISLKDNSNEYYKDNQRSNNEGDDK